MKPNPFSFENHLTVPVSTSDNDVLPENSVEPSDAGTRTPDNVSSRSRVCKDPAPVTSGLHGAPQEQCNRHRTGACGNRAEMPGNAPDGPVDVAANPLVGPREAHVEHRRAGLHNRGRDDPGNADRSDDDVCPAHLAGEVGGPRMAH